ncbi:MAG: hypothetical protein VXW32_06485 [Myxococcota bacterium]|nr:hypothetical protein [Myxococcota bacterium]
MKRWITWTCLLLLFGCSAERRMLLKDRAETSRLGESAELYWKALRWGDHAAAAAFIQGSEARLAWLEEASGSGARQYRSAEVISVEAGPVLELDPRGIQREGQVITRVVYYTLPSQVLKNEMVKQEWVRKPTGWFIQD